MKICDKMQLASANQNEYLIKQGNKGNLFFVIEKGVVSVQIKGKEVKTLIRGDTLGELSLLYNQPRSASIQCLTQCEVWYIDRHQFSQAVEKLVTRSLKENLKYLKRLSFFKYLTNPQKDQLARCVVQTYYKAGQVFEKENEPY